MLPQGRLPYCRPPESPDARRGPGSRKEVPASAHHPPDSGEPFSTKSHRGAPEAAGILDWAPASMGLRSAEAIQQTASSDVVKTVKLRDDAADRCGSTGEGATTTGAATLGGRSNGATEGLWFRKGAGRKFNSKWSGRFLCRGSFRFTRGFFFAIPARNLAQRFRRRVRRVDSWRLLRCRSRRGQFFAACFGQLFVFGREDARALQIFIGIDMVRSGRLLRFLGLLLTRGFGRIVILRR